MINLVEYREYWERMKARIEGLDEVMPVTIDDEIGKKIQGLPKGSVTLFFLPPTSESKARDVDAYEESDLCVVLVMEKYDPQRRTAFSVLETTQAIAEKVKRAMRADMSNGCPVMSIDVATMNTLPETGLFASFAGWSIGFQIKN